MKFPSNSIYLKEFVLFSVNIFFLIFYIFLHTHNYLGLTDGDDSKLPFADTRPLEYDKEFYFIMLIVNSILFLFSIISIYYLRSKNSIIRIFIYNLILNIYLFIYLIIFLFILMVFNLSYNIEKISYYIIFIMLYLITNFILAYFINKK